MQRFLLLCLVIAAIVWLGFSIFPGHSYLYGETQIYVPVMERLAHPGFLSRDLVATHPYVTYTIYDEVTLFLHQIFHLNFQTALAIQQVLCRAAIVSGIFQLARAAGLDDIFALLVAALFQLGSTLAGPAISTVDREPTPTAFAFGLVLLAIGLFAKKRPLLGGLSGGIALIYDARIAFAFWVTVLLMILFDRKLRPLFKVTLAELLIFTLLLANLAQLQPGAAGTQITWDQIPDWLAKLQQYRTSYVWVSSWAGKYLVQYVAIWICAIWAMARIWPILNRQTRWFLLLLSTAGLLSVGCSFVGVELMRNMAFAQIQPAQNLVFTAALTSVSCSIAAARAARAQMRFEAILWLIVVFAVAMNSAIFDFFRASNLPQAGSILLCVTLAFGLATLMLRLNGKFISIATFLAPVAASFTIPALFPQTVHLKVTPLNQLADWAEANTWGSSLFLFPDTLHSLEPGYFRAKSRRGLWVDWQGGVLADYSEDAASEWRSRWKQMDASRLTPRHLEQLLPLEIDYYVLRRPHVLQNIKPVFENNLYIVYDATDLRNATAPLRFAAPP
jgi:hypothetical protein